MQNREDWPDLQIKPGHDPGACFWVQPVRLAEDGERDTEDDGNGNHIFCGVVEHKAQEISLDEWAVECFLWYFLKKHFNRRLSVKYRDPRSEDFTEEFEWYLTHNVYTYDEMKAMIADIRHASELLKKDFKNSELTPVKSYFPKDLKESEWGETRKQGVALATSFYFDFCRSVEKMMANSPNFEHISVMGP